MSVFVLYLAAINLITFFVYGADKRRAKIPGARRVPEKTLFALALLLGSAGALLGMRVFHHKTRHWYFRFGIPAILFCQIAGCLCTCGFSRRKKFLKFFVRSCNKSPLSCV